jgi:hypothetical protein
MPSGAEHADEQWERRCAPGPGACCARRDAASSTAPARLRADPDPMRPGAYRRPAPGGRQAARLGPQHPDPQDQGAGHGLEPLPEQQPGEALVCDGGDIDENVYTYRDMIPIPLESRGHCRCDLRLRGIDARITAKGESIELRMQATPKYIEHIRPEQGDG